MEYSLPEDIENRTDSDMTIYNYDYGDYNFANDPLIAVSDVIDKYIPPVFIGICVITNILNMLIFWKFCCKSSCFVFHLLAAPLDFLVIFNVSANPWIYRNYNIDLRTILSMKSELWCKLYSFFESCIYQADIWCYLVPIIEMCLITRTPTNAHHICTQERVKHTGLLLLLLIVCVNGHFFFTYGHTAQYSDRVKSMECTFLPSGGRHEIFTDYLWPIIALLIQTILPLVISIAGVVYMCIRRNYRALLDNRHLIYPHLIIQRNICSIVLGIAFVILTVPQAGYEIFEFILEKYAVEKYFSERILAGQVTSSFKDIFMSLKIVVYLATMQEFRMTLVRLFTCSCCAHRKPQSRTSSTRSNSLKRLL